jgi:hypothetical protein
MHEDYEYVMQDKPRLKAWAPIPRGSAEVPITLEVR